MLYNQLAQYSWKPQGIILLTARLGCPISITVESRQLPTGMSTGKPILDSSSPDFQVMSIQLLELAVTNTFEIVRYKMNLRIYFSRFTYQGQTSRPSKEFCSNHAAIHFYFLLQRNSFMSNQTQIEITDPSRGGNCNYKKGTICP